MIREISLKFRVHTDQEAADAVLIGIKNARASRQALVKVIHGYGSDGVGGTNKKTIHDLLSKLQSSGEVKSFHPGESLNSGILSALSRRFNGYKQSLNRLQRDCGNEGITLVVIW